ncbi:DUF354 domain-containing protein (plasmid) [Haloferacaceae archaeon DSL9]
MDAVFTIQHPGHVHFFKHAVHELDAAGHGTHVFVRDKSVIQELLRHEGIDHEVLTGPPGSSVIKTQLRFEWKLLRRARPIDPDVVAGVGGVSASHIARLTGAKGIAFSDTEHATLSNRLAFPFAHEICTPTWFTDDLGAKQYRYPSYHELAYLHPNRFDPDPAVLDEVGVEPDERFVVFRLVDWNASHDAGQGGFDNVADAVESLEETGATVLITSEAPLPEEIRDRRATVEPHRLHDLLAYADLFIGEGATTAAECAVLGTPAVYINSLPVGYLTRIEQQYELVFHYPGPDRQQRGLEKAMELLENADDYDWDARRDELLSDALDTTDVIVDRVLTAGGEPR